MSFYLNLSFGPKWDDSATLRDFVTNILSSGIVKTDDANKDKLESFEVVFDEIKEGDPQEIYKKMMLRSLTEPQVSQLGLARIKCECNADISYELSNDFGQVIIPPGVTFNHDDYELLMVTVTIPVKLIENTSTMTTEPCFSVDN